MTLGGGRAVSQDWPTIGLLLITGVYAFLTWRLVRKASASAGAAERSAEASELSAAIARESAQEERAQRRLAADRERRLLLAGLLVEIEENLEMRRAMIPIMTPFALDLWQTVKGQLGDLGEETVTALVAAYQRAYTFNELLAAPVLDSDLTLERDEAIGWVLDAACAAFEEAKDKLRESLE